MTIEDRATEFTKILAPENKKDILETYQWFVEQLTEEYDE